jgi:hypothetical protein
MCTNKAKYMGDDLKRLTEACRAEWKGYADDEPIV